MGALVLFVAAFCVYAATASPVLGWLDSPEFVAASASLGVSHSPGHPAQALLGRLGSLLPVGDVAFRVNLMSALCAAGCAVAVYSAVRVVLEKASSSVPDTARSLIAAGVGMVFAFCWASWIQAVRAEVYALVGLMCIGVIGAVLKLEATRDRRWLVWAGLLSGLALATHHLIALLTIVPAAVLVLSMRSMRRPRTLGMCAAAGVLGLALLAYLPIRSQAGPQVNWGAPHTVERFAWTVTAKAFQKATTQELATTRKQAVAALIITVAEETTIPLSALALFGVIWAMRRRAIRAPAGLLLGVFSFGLAGRWLVGFEPGVPDHHGYLLAALAAWLALAAVGVAALIETVCAAAPSLRRGGPVIAGVAVLLIAPVQLAANSSDSTMRGHYASDELARWELLELPSRSLLLLAYFETSFRVAALRVVENTRPDISIVDRSFLTYPGTDVETKRRYPQLSALIDAPLRAGMPTPIAPLSSIAARRPVLFQLHINLERDVHPNLVPTGPFAMFLPINLGDATRDGAERFDRSARKDLEARVISGAAGSDREGALRAGLWHDVMRMSLYCSVRRARAAQEALEWAWSVAPGDATLVDTAQACGLQVPR